jgi:hypothetical protein
MEYVVIYLYVLCLYNWIDYLPLPNSMKENQMELFNGDRVIVNDNRLYINDVKTPPEIVNKPATIIRRYGIRSEYNANWIYPDCIDVQFDHRDEGDISHGHFTNGAIPIE